MYTGVKLCVDRYLDRLKQELEDKSRQCKETLILCAADRPKDTFADLQIDSGAESLLLANVQTAVRASDSLQKVSRAMSRVPVNGVCDTQLAIGSLVLLLIDTADQPTWYIILPARPNGSISISLPDLSVEVMATPLTPESPMGAAVMGQVSGEVVQYFVGGSDRIAEILQII